MFTVVKRESSTSKETIHSGHFMVSQFEAEEQDDEYELAVPIPEQESNEFADIYKDVNDGVDVQDVVAKTLCLPQPLPIDTSLSKLFQCMTIAYRQKLTSPKWNRFRGIRLRWKDKIRLNNVIWRCWHMQFIKKKDTYICQFASPLDVDTHNKPEAIVLEGKYWKRKLAAVTAEYKKWRMFYRTHVLGHVKDAMDTLSDFEAFAWQSQSSDSMHMMVDEDYLGLMSDTLFSTISSQPFVFPDSREIAKAGLADFIQPSLGPLQPNLDDYMDTFEPLQELFSVKLPPVPEENGVESLYYRHHNANWCFNDLELLGPNMNAATNNFNPPAQPQVMEKSVPVRDTGPQLPSYTNEMMIHPVEVYLPQQPQTSVYQLPVISKPNKTMKKMPQPSMSYNKSDAMYPTYSLSDICNVENRVQLPTQQQTFKSPQIVEANQQLSRGYKFQSPTKPPNLKFTSPNSNNYKSQSRSHLHTQASSSSMQVKPVIEKAEEDKLENSGRSVRKTNRQRSISMSREPIKIKRPPLISAISDPSLVTPTNSVLLTQLLTNNSQNVFQQSSNLSIKSERSASCSSIIDDHSTMSLLNQPQTSSSGLIITSGSSATDSALLPSLSGSNASSPSSSHGIGSCPTSPQGILGSPTRDKDQRRVGHIHAEQKRRYNIKNGFDMIHSLIPHLNKNPNPKLSKAAMLQKGAEYIRQLQQERNQLKEEMDSLRQQIDALSTSISNCQSLLPATGAPVSRRRDSKIQEMFDNYVKKRTMEDWKFWIFSLLFRSLLTSFNNFVSTSSLEDLYRSTLHWVEQHCTLNDLRPVAFNSLKYLSTKTDVLSQPEKLPEEARQAASST